MSGTLTTVRPAVAAPLLAFALALAACTPTSIYTPERPVQPAAPPAPHAAMLDAAVDLDGLAVGPLAPDQRATIAMVFASWCGHCRDEMLVLGALHARHPEVRFLGVNYQAHEEYDGRGDAGAVRSFVAQRGPWLRVVPADDALWSRLGRPPKVPTLYVFDAAGNLAHTYDRRTAPPPSLDELESALAGL